MITTFYPQSLWNRLVAAMAQVSAIHLSKCVTAVDGLPTVDDEESDLAYAGRIMETAKLAGHGFELAAELNNKQLIDEALLSAFSRQDHIEIIFLNQTDPACDTEIRKLIQKMASNSGRPCRQRASGLRQYIDSGVALVLVSGSIDPHAEEELASIADCEMLQRRAVSIILDPAAPYPAGSEKLREHHLRKDDEVKAVRFALLVEELLQMVESKTPTKGRVVLGDVPKEFEIERTRLRISLAKEGADVRPLGRYVEDDPAIPDDLAQASLFVQMLTLGQDPSNEIREQGFYAAASRAECVLWRGGTDSTAIHTGPDGICGSPISLQNYILERLAAAPPPLGMSTSGGSSDIDRFDLLMLCHSGDPAVESMKEKANLNELSFRIAYDSDSPDDLKALALRADRFFIGSGFDPDRLLPVLEARRERQKAMNSRESIPLVREATQSSANPLQRDDEIREKGIAEGLDRVDKEWKAHTDLKAKTVQVFYAHSDRNEPDLTRLQEELTTYRIRNVIADWADHEMAPGDQIHPTIFAKLLSADVVLVLLTNQFLTSKYAKIETEVFKKYRGERVVVPLYMRAIPELKETLTYLELDSYSMLLSSDEPVMTNPDMNLPSLAVRLGKTFEKVRRHS